ncbi:MAG: type I 3-dehydroquinate dehydratase [Clostridia bacterium]|nr:type I 3-dehydroquinate dehydratase [Clostridia bacterium]
MKSFLNSDKPIITGMITDKTLDEVLARVERYKNDGVEAFCFQMEQLVPEDKRPERLKLIFDAMADYPVYVTNYMRSNSEQDTISWETIEEQLLLARSLGATLIDIPTDMYHPSDMEFTTDSAAIERQTAFIAKLHELGAEVLMSAHVLRFIPKETAFAIALAQKSRGADVAKIVTSADTDDELYENFEICMMLRKNLGIKSLFLCGGEKRRMHRLLGPLFGSAIYLVRENGTDELQPAVERAKRAREYMN